jgi:hypothetical protein
MSENEKKHDGQNCCCCQSWKAIFIAIAFMVIGAVLGHMLTMMHRCCHMHMHGDNYGMRVCQDKGPMECKGGFENNCRQGKESENKADMGKCKPGCTCPKCSKKAASLSDPNKAACPKMDKNKGKVRKD